jgi:DNA-binding ferritin-like protein
MKLAQARTATTAERLETLEKRADGHDKVIAAVTPIGEQVKEMFEAWTMLKNFNWFVVKIGAIIGGALGFIAVALTIAEKVSHFTGH